MHKARIEFCADGRQDAQLRIRLLLGDELKIRCAERFVWCRPSTVRCTDEIESARIHVDYVCEDGRQVAFDVGPGDPAALDAIQNLRREQSPERAQIQWGPLAARCGVRTALAPGRKAPTAEQIVAWGPVTGVRRPAHANFVVDTLFVRSRNLAAAACERELFGERAPSPRSRPGRPTLLRFPRVARL